MNFQVLSNVFCSLLLKFDKGISFFKSSRTIFNHARQASTTATNESTCEFEVSEEEVLKPAR